MNLFQLLRNNKPLLVQKLRFLTADRVTESNRSPETLTADSLARQARMAEKLAIIKAEMGDKYILHPKHKVNKLAEPKGY